MIQEMFDIKGQVALITGGNSGIGLSITETLIKAGARIAIMNRNASSGKAIVDQLSSQGGEAISLPGDITNPEEVKVAVEATITHYGNIDILVNSAGINIRKKAVDFELSEWKKILDINLTGTFLVCQEVGRHMINRRKGRIINISSVAAAIPLPDRAPYCASKAGVTQLTKALALEWAPYGININAVGPGFINTPLIAELMKDPSFQKKIEDTVPLKRVGETADLQGIVLTLCSKAGEYITGQTIYIDGGLSL
jgi:NAD(P)-dependent dehydrogenase (short-subunit alcohol dehydrogenase family)